METNDAETIDQTSEPDSVRKRYIEIIARKFLSQARKNLEDWTVTLFGEEFTIEKLFETAVYGIAIASYTILFHEIHERKKYTDEEHDEIKEVIEETNDHLHTIRHKLDALDRLLSNENQIH